MGLWQGERERGRGGAAGVPFRMPEIDRRNGATAYQKQGKERERAASTVGAGNGEAVGGVVVG